MMDPRTNDTLTLFAIMGFLLFVAVSAASCAELDDLKVDDRIYLNRGCAPYDVSDYEGYRRGYRRLKDRMLADAGGPVDAYTLSRYADDSDLDVDHVVPRKAAHYAGLCNRSDGEKDRFSRDPTNLALTHWYINRTVKRASGSWMPPKDKCAYASTVVDIRDKYGLSVTKREKRALHKALETCHD